MVEILAITFAAADFPVDGAPNPGRASAAARSFAANSLRGLAGVRIEPIEDGAVVLVPEPYPFVGALKAVPAGQGDINLLGKPRPRSSWEGNYLGGDRIVLNVDPLAPDVRS